MQPVRGLPDCSVQYVMAMVTQGEGQLAMSSGSPNEQQGVPQCNASWVGLCYQKTGRALCPQSCPMINPFISAENTDLQF